MARRFAPPRFSFLGAEPAVSRGIAFLERILAAGRAQAFVEGRFAPAGEFTRLAVKDLSKPDAIRAAMEGPHKLRATYTRKYDGATAEYTTRPYEVKPHDSSGVTMLYATEDGPTGHGPRQIHSFIYSRVLSAEVLPETRFAPVWPVQPGSI